jgi:hypothetical protein
MTTLSERSRRSCQDAFRKGYDWYLSQQEADGSLGTPPTDEATFYNTLYVFAVGGRWNEAQRFSQWARWHIIDDDGTLRVDHKGIFATRAVYFKGWHMFGAHLCGLFDMSVKTIDALLPYQDKGCGGFYVSKARMEAGEGLVELNTTGMGGLACLVTGRMEEAVAAGDFIAGLLDKQPGLNKGLYGYVDPREGALVISREPEAADDIYVDEETGQSTDIDRYLFYYDNDSDEIQAYANLGVPLAFLCYLHNATGLPPYRDAALKLFGFLEYAGEKCWIKGQTTKVLWGLVLLHDITGDERVLGAIRALCDHLCETQLENGAWVAPIAFDDFAKQPKWISICLAGDILLSIRSVLSYLG